MAKSVFTCFHILKPTMNKWPNTQLKYKLRYSPIQYTYLGPLATHFQTIYATELASRLEINTELVMFALISWLMR